MRSFVPFLLLNASCSIVAVLLGAMFNLPAVAVFAGYFAGVLGSLGASCWINTRNAALHGRQVWESLEASDQHWHTPTDRESG